MEQKSNIITCEACKKKGKRSIYHLWPKKKWDGAGPTVTLCEACHRRLERMIRDAEVLLPERYEEIYQRFLETFLEDEDE